MSKRFATFSLLLFALVFGAFGYALVKTNANIESVATAVSNSSQAAGVFFEESVSEENLLKRYEHITKLKEKDPEAKIRMTKNERPIRILVVPGHDNISRGTQFNGIDEVEFTRIVSEKLANYLRQEPMFEVMNAYENGDYAPQLLKYFEENSKEILDFREEYKKVMEEHLENGLVEKVSTVDHNLAPTDVATKLYGINKWANEKKVDLVIHVHFNDFRGRKRDTAGKYSGYSIYIPDRQFSNYKVSKIFAENVFDRLGLFWNSSDLPIEQEGIIEDQDLIAIGAYNTLNPASILIEYGYIYEGRFQNESVRDDIFNEMAFQTYIGVKDFFEEDDLGLQTTLLPYKWSKSFEDGIGYDKDVLHLQGYLSLEGHYPPEGESIYDCPVTGFYGKCTVDALQEFQIENGLAPANGFLGQKTREVLNNLVFE